MDNYLEATSDTSSSNQTIVVENDEIDNILKKYSSGDFTLPSTSKASLFKENENKGILNLPSTSKAPSSTKNIYNLDDFSDEEFNYEPLEKRIHKEITKNNTESFGANSSWQDKFSAEDFCEDSNDIDAVLNRISQLESEQFSDKPKQHLSKEVESLISGDIIEKPKPKNSSNKNSENSSQWSGSSDENKYTDFSLFKLKDDFKFDPKLSDTESLNLENLIPASKDILDEPKPKRLKKGSGDKEAQILEKEMAKAAKAKEKEQKRLEKENQKQLKNALKVVENCVKPDHCIEYMTVNLDENLSKKHYGEVIKAGLKSGGYNYKVSEQLFSNLISWTRKVPTLENMFLQNVIQQEKHYLLVMDTPEFIQYIFSETLVDLVQSLLAKEEIEHLTIAILGLQKYYKYLKEEKNKQFKAAVADTDINKKSTNIEFKNLPKVSKYDIELKLVELQIFCKNIYVRPVEKYEDLAVFVGECTKSIAQIPYKMAKAESLHHESEFFIVNNRDCVRVDKDGNGLGRLWNQCLRMFPLASLETAEAVSSVYPTMHALMEAYQNCKSPEEAEKMLQDLPVRRAAGPLSGQRKIGPEFSKKAYRFFCSTENILL